MFKKVFLVVFALSILALVISLMIWDSREAKTQDVGTQRSTRIDYIEDQSPSLIAFDPAGRVWVYGSDDVLNKYGTLVVYEDRKATARFDERDSPVLQWLPSFTSRIAFGEAGTVWIGTNEEDRWLAMLNGDSWTTFTNSSGLPSTWVTALKVDSRGRAWIGLYDHGLAVFDRGDWEFYTTENSGLSVDTVHDIAFDDRGRAWITTDRGGVNIFDGMTWSLLNTENSGLAHDQVDTILFDDRGRAWIDTWVDISVYDEQNNSWLHLIFVIPQFENMFKGFGAELPARTQMVIHISHFFRDFWWLMLLILGGGVFFIGATYKRSEKMQHTVDRLILRAPVVGEIVKKATIARYSRTLGTMFAGGVPLVESLDSVAGAAGNRVYYEGVIAIKNEVTTGTHFRVAMEHTGLFPNMVVQMVAIGEESGELDKMLGKVADFYEAEVDDAVEALSRLLLFLAMDI